MFDDSRIHYFLLSAAVLTVVLPLLGSRFQKPVLPLLARWVRWFLFAALFSYVLRTFELSWRPDWVHFLVGFALWFVLETGYNWIAIKALSRSDIPLFPEFRINNDGDEWPADAKFIEIKDWLRREKYQRLEALKAELFTDTYLRASVYESPAQATRIQILFLPKAKGGTTACFTISSRTSDDERIVTDNFFLPFGGYYPENWSMCRRPLIGSLRRLFALHQRRIKRRAGTLVPVEDSALEEVNEQQRILERLNTEIGFLVPRPQREEEGKITPDGRYRLWKEMWLLAYFGKSVA
jgi:hypothetical protein